MKKKRKNFYPDSQSAILVWIDDALSSLSEQDGIKNLKFEI